MKTLYIATHNKHKEEEIRGLFSAEPVLASRFKIESLNALDFHEDIPETGTSLEENARQKAQYIYKKFGVDCFADDTGLEVEAIGMRPGIYSARYANLPASFEKDGLVTPESLSLPDPTFDNNIDRLLRVLENEENRRARFRSVICLILEGREYFFEGCINGEIVRARRGTEGFGYDPVFLPDGFNKSFAQLTLEEKNAVSHRGKAIAALMQFLIQQGF